MAKPLSYKDAGVDIDAGDKAVELMKRYVKETYNKHVLAGVGSFGGMFDIGDNKVLVGSTDGVGTKIKLAFLTGTHDTVGQDLVNHCTNDILVQGAKPLFFFDYYSTSKLNPEDCANVVKGFAKACKENGCVLLGGETAEMPGLYKPGEYDIAGFIVGMVDKDKIITGDSIKPGDKVIGLKSTGLQTNGYSLAFMALCNNDLGKLDKETIAELMAVHASFLHVVEPVLGKLKGMAHITGGGLIENIPRVLPENVDVKINKVSWTVPNIFRKIQKAGNIAEQEMFRTFNMGIGMVLMVDAKDAAEVAKKTGGILIGEVVPGKQEVKIV